jgi:hypothetical protein
MNDHDRNNLNFLLTVSPEVFDDWMDQADEDDIDYAIELLRMRKSELTVEFLDKTDDVEQLIEAQSALSKFTLKG